MCDFEQQYLQLEEEFKNIVSQENNNGLGGIYIPNPVPSKIVDYIFVGMEPSLGGWTNKKNQQQDAIQQVNDGFKNFLLSDKDLLLHFAIRQYLLKSRQLYHITDIAKGALLVKDAKKLRSKRYPIWEKSLVNEFKLLSKNTTKIISIGADKDQIQTLNNIVGNDSFSTILHFGAHSTNLRAKIQEYDLCNEFKQYKKSFDYNLLWETVENIYRDFPQTERHTRKRSYFNNLHDTKIMLPFLWKQAFSKIK